MWLINVDTLNLKYFIHAPPYAILSHQWGPDEEEVTFTELRSEPLRNSAAIQNKQGFAKIQGCCIQALIDGFEYVWVDTYCINKKSSADLSEAINSMFNWYAKAAQCYTYLSDVLLDEGLTQFPHSRWSLQGWTLQELIAPKDVQFFDRNWQFMGARSELVQRIAEITSVDARLLVGTQPISDYNAAQKMSWAAKRQMARAEDIAYCLMGLFDVNMPLLYGEGDKAFIHLQEEIIRKDDDHTLFVWSHPQGIRCFSGLLAPNPSFFDTEILNGLQHFGGTIALDHNAWLDCVQKIPGLPLQVSYNKVGIFLRKLKDEDQYVRFLPGTESFHVRETRPDEHISPQIIRSRDTTIHVRNNPSHVYSDPKPEIYDFITRGALHSADSRDRYGKVLPDNKIAHLGSGDFGTALIAKFPAGHKCVWAVFGFDFQFNPVCILHAAPCQHHGLGVNHMQSCLPPFASLADPKSDPCLTFHEWNIMPDGKWLRLGRHSIKDSVWYLKGDRTNGLQARLDFDPTPAGLTLFVSIEKSFHGDLLGWSCQIH